MIDLCIFDLDGTLADTLESISYSTNQALSAVGLLTIEKEVYRRLAGDGVDELIRRSLLVCGDEKLEKFEETRTRYKDIFSKNDTYHAHPYAGIKELLMNLRELGIKSAVLSNKPHNRTISVVNKLFNDFQFDIVQGQNDTLKKKPAPDGVYYILEKLGLSDKKKSCLYIGDTDTDMQTGRAAGLSTVGVLWGFRDRLELEKNHADFIVDHPEQILDICKSKM